MPTTAFCRNCQWFRAYRPTSQLLLRDLGSTDPQVATEVLKVMQDEHQRQDAEAEQKNELIRMEDQQWHTRPSMSDYCGRHEDKQLYLIDTLKNIGGKCGEDGGDFKPFDKVRRDCASCRHQVVGGGEARDAGQFARLEQLAISAAVLERGRGSALIDEYKNFVSTAKALEAAQAYYAGRFVDKRPDYLPTCGHEKYSSDSEFVPCCMQNPHDRCREWEPRADTPSAATLSFTDALNMI